MLAAACTALAFAITPLNVINVAITSYDIHKGSKTKLAAKRRDHVKMLNEDRTEIREAVQSYYKLNE